MADLQTAQGIKDTDKYNFIRKSAKGRSYNHQIKVGTKQFLKDFILGKDIEFDRGKVETFTYNKLKGLLVELTEEDRKIFHNTYLTKVAKNNLRYSFMFSKYFSRYIGGELKFWHMGILSDEKLKELAKELKIDY